MNNLKTSKIILFITIIIISSCGGKKPESAAPQASGAGSPPIRRIISAAPSNTEIIIGLGLGDKLVAVDKYSRDIAGVNKNLPEIDFFNPDTEAIIGLEPDIILSNEINAYGEANNQFALLNEMGIRLAQIPTSNSIEGIYSDIALIAETLGAKEKGEALKRALENEIEKIRAIGALIAPKKTVYFEIESMPGMITFGKGVYLNEMIEITGAKNIFESQKGWFTAGAESVINANPDVIFVFANPGLDPMPGIKKRAGFETINAVKQNQIYIIDADSASRPTQNIIIALKQMAKAVYPGEYETE